MDQFVHSTKFDANILVRSMGCARRVRVSLRARNFELGSGSTLAAIEVSPPAPLHGDAAVKVVLHSAMAAMLLALLTTRLQDGGSNGVQWCFLGAVLPRRGAEP